MLVKRSCKKLTDLTVKRSKELEHAGKFPSTPLIFLALPKHNAAVFHAPYRQSVTRILKFRHSLNEF